MDLILLLKQFFQWRALVDINSIYRDASIFCKIIAPPSMQPVDKRWPDVEVVIKIGN
jgi:hypothetical protein